MAARQRRHSQERHLQPVARRTGAAASANPEAEWQQLITRTFDEVRIEHALARPRINRELIERSEELMRRYRCTALRRCTDHSALVEHETGVSIDDPALKKLAGLARVFPVKRTSDAELLTWMCDTGAYLHEVAKRLAAIAETAPDEANSVRDIVRDYARQARRLACGFSTARVPLRWVSEADATPMDSLGRAAGAVRTWVQEHAPTCRTLWQVVAAILVHHGWEIRGATLRHQADSLRQLVRRRAV